jgi:N-acyl-D-aspartate/D-glutamate deacylase
MTSAPARRLGLKDRGLIREGCKADITVFDPVNIRDVATFTDPHQYSEGIEYVIVNGIPIIKKGEYLNRYPGRVLRKV